MRSGTGTKYRPQPCRRPPPTLLHRGPVGLTPTQMSEARDRYSLTATGAKRPADWPAHLVQRKQPETLTEEIEARESRTNPQGSAEDWKNL